MDKRLFAVCLIIILVFSISSSILPVGALSTRPEIIFDKEDYTPFDRVTASMVYPAGNRDPNRRDIIYAEISSSLDTIKKHPVVETGANTGIFEGIFKLTPNEAIFPGDILVTRGDVINVTFNLDAYTTASKSVFTNYHVGQVMFDKDAFRITERGVLRVIDPDANIHPDTIDATEVRFWSTTDRGGLLVTLRETGARTGIFEEIITFTLDEESTGTRLRVSEGDTITVKYTDNTLPAPAVLGKSGVYTVDVEELFGTALMGTVTTGKVSVSSARLVDAAGSRISNVLVGQQVLVQSTVNNNQDMIQEYAYIVQIKDSDDIVVSLSWVQGSINAKQSLKVAQSWLPNSSGEYLVQIFVWQSVTNPLPLTSKITELKVNVST